MLLKLVLFSSKALQHPQNNHILLELLSLPKYQNLEIARFRNSHHSIGFPESNYIIFIKLFINIKK